MSQRPANKPLAGRWLMLRIWLSAWAARIEWDFRNGLTPFTGSSYSWVFRTSTCQKFKYQVNSTCNPIVLLVVDRATKYLHCKSKITAIRGKLICPEPIPSQTKKRAPLLIPRYYNQYWSHCALLRSQHTLHQTLGFCSLHSHVHNLCVPQEVPLTTKKTRKWSFFAL